MKNIDNLNVSRLNDITKEEVKALPMFKHFSDIEAEEVVRTLKRFSEIIVNDYFNRENKDKER